MGGGLRKVEKMTERTRPRWLEKYRDVEKDRHE